jgi:predicted aspartyl protease
MRYELVITLDELEDDEAVAAANGLARGMRCPVAVVEIGPDSRRVVATITPMEGD